RPLSHHFSLTSLASVGLIYLVVVANQVGASYLSKLTPVDQDIIKEQSEECHLLHSAWNDLTKVWTLPVIHALSLKQPARFNELKRRIQNISATSLAERLNELDQRKVIERKVYPEVPPVAKRAFSLWATSSSDRPVLGNPCTIVTGFPHLRNSTLTTR